MVEPVEPVDPVEPLPEAAEAAEPGWRAELALGFERQGPRSVLARRRHDGPLVVQKALYPEGEGICHAIVVHPPAGIAGGDALQLSAELDPGAQVLLTTPGAGKWYRSAGRRASQALSFRVGAGARLEWLPQETIVFDGALADLKTELRLAEGASYIGWEILCLGRTGSGERFERGDLRLELDVWRGEALAWTERGRIEAGGALMESPVGLGGLPVCGTMIVAGEIPDELLVRCREAVATDGEGAVTRLPGLLIGRYLGKSGAAARRYFIELWKRARPVVCGREAVEPRIWRT
jgi:urease accessory protein